jgi:hypothetical protein
MIHWKTPWIWANPLAWAVICAVVPFTLFSFVIMKTLHAFGMDDDDDGTD